MLAKLILLASRALIGIVVVVLLGSTIVAGNPLGGLRGRFGPALAAALTPTIAGVSASPNVSSTPSATNPDILTVLLLGIDQRPDEAAKHIPSRTDTMILAVVDGKTKRAALVSIPRDLVVAIPNHGNQKINTAHFWGDTDVPGSGPTLAMRTVELNFGVRVDYYARVDFAAFQKTVDAVGGVVVDVKRPILDDEYPTPDYGVIRVFIPAGPQLLDGAHALQYVRSRHSDNDFGRQERQRQVILAAERQLLRPEIVLKVPELASVVQNSVGTDFPATKLPWLAYLAASISAKSVANVGITYDMVVDVNKDGSEFLPDRAKIQQLLDSVLGEPLTAPVGATQSGATSNQPSTVEVLNGTTRAGLAAATADLLTSKGYAIAKVAQADTSDHLHTSVVDRSGARHDGPLVAKAIGVPAAVVTTASPTANSADVTIVLGYDEPDPIRP